jgi:polyphosphate kinase
MRVRSILGRFLEHSRVFWFANGGEPEVWIGSADIMHRNLDRRVEALVQISDAAHRRYLTRLLDLGFDDGTASWHLGSDDLWVRHAEGPDGEPLRDLQEHFVALTVRRADLTAT